MGRSNFSPEKKVDVKFTDDYGISEGAVDNGGPTREFFRLCLHEIKDKIAIFEGPPNSKLLTCNSKAMKDNTYFYAGQIMAMSIAHGGQSPCFLSELLYECLQKGPDNVKVKIEHITDEETKSQLKSILQAENELQLHNALTQAGNLISLAGHNVRVTLENKQEIALDLAHWYVLQRTRAPFERFRDGLMSLGVLDALRRYPLQLKCLFVKGEKALTAIDVERISSMLNIPKEGVMHFTKRAGPWHSGKTIFRMLNLKTMSLWRMFLFSALDVTAFQHWVSLQSQALSLLPIPDFQWQILVKIYFAYQFMQFTLLLHSPALVFVPTYM
ncbi:G2/M phase-specific E3 ubiquitin-protein ligase-like [Misgurnus anguillicaudatus]|uniref:G2/M phase-specific E3 ubiquitin-protein ligase-like n=1 Tax=Misgurnus anguillicaudatus TaxID=75329 RepID=UPI003CCEFB9B